jgi:hypothetical protein
MEQEKKRTTKPQSERGTHCIARTQEKLTSQAQHVHMLHKAYPALNLSRHLAHLTGTQKKPEREPQAHTADDGTHAKKPLQFLSPLLLDGLSPVA